MKCSTRIYLAVATLASIAATGPATAESLKQWWPLKVMDASSGKDVPAEYVPLPKAEKAYNLCVLFPHLKDSFWLGADYGVVEEVPPGRREYDPVRSRRLRELEPPTFAI